MEGLAGLGGKELNNNDLLTNCTHPDIYEEINFIKTGFSTLNITLLEAFPWQVKLACVRQRKITKQFWAVTVNVD